MKITSSRFLVRTLALLWVLPLSAALAAAQTAPPIQGVTGTIATDTSREATAKAGHAIAEGAAKAAKKLVPGGGKGDGQTPLEGFSEGRRVVVQTEAKAGDEPATTTEGVVVDLNRKRQQITVRFADKKTQTLRFVVPPAVSNVVVSYTDATGAKITGAFTSVS